jgi:hypothetical protein
LYSNGSHSKGNKEKMEKNPPNCGEENQVFGNPSVGVKTKEMRNCE